MPKWIFRAGIIIAVLSLIPFAIVAKNRASKSETTRRQIVPDMDKQPSFRAQERNPLFADGRAMRPAAEGTVPWSDGGREESFTEGKSEGEWVARIPVPVTDELMLRGRERYDIYCSPCHGLDGSGSGMAALRAEELQEGTWTPPTSYHTGLIRQRPAGHLFNTITNGIRNMPAYGDLIPEEDRWAIVAYLRALQRSRNASIDDVPEERRSTLR